MFNIGLGECIVVLLVAIYMIKPQHFPVIAKIAARRLQLVKQSMQRMKAEFKAIVQDSPSNHEP